MAGRPRGLPKTGGRSKGTPNKESRSLFAKCEALGLDPFAELLELCKEKDKGKEFLRLQALKEVCSYLYPKRKSLEHSGNIDPKMFEAAEVIASLSKEEKIQLLQDELEALKHE